MADLDNGLKMLLRASDDVKATLEVLVIPTASDTQIDTPVNYRQYVSNFRTRRIIAVISHRDELDHHEEGSVFVLKQKPQNHAYPESLEIQRVFPVCGDFSISMAQMRVGSVGGSQDRTGLRITVSPSPQDEPLSFYTQDVQGLQRLLGEHRRLKELSETFVPLSPSQTYSWLAPYATEHTLPIITSIPPDLRVLHQPLHERLSPASAGSPGDDTHDILLLRDDWVRTQAREQTRKGRAQLNIRVGTFNVNGQTPSQDLVSWVRGTSDYTGSHLIPPFKELSPFSIGDIEKDPLEFSTKSSLRAVDTPPIPSTSTAVSVAPKELPDILVLGFQELDLSTEALLYSTSTFREEVWCTAVFAALGEHQYEYTKLASKQLVGILIVVIVRKSIAHRFSDVRTSSAGVGIMGVMGNKGGTAVQVDYKGGSGDDASESGMTVLTFVNSHLAAFDEMFDKRNIDFTDLAKRLIFDLELGVTIWESDVIFWMGDLNYRVDQPDNDVRELLFEADQHRWARRRNLNALMAHDQLRNAMQSGQAFDHFSEHPITHPPSYRYSPGLSTDALGYDVKRKPAWTDRILNLVGPAVTLKQHTYTSHAHITMSDHRPVSADFTLEVDIYNEKARLTAARSLYRQLQGLELESRKVGVEPEEVRVGKVRYKQRVTRTVRLRNDGKNPCVFRFVPPTPEGGICPPWLTIQPVTGILLPYQPLDVTLTINVDEGTPHYMRDLDCTLVLHTGPGLGKDRFIVVQGDYQPSCIGVPLVNLTALPGPIRTTWGQSNSKQNLNSPREVMRLVNWMMDNRLIEAFSELEETTGHDQEGSVFTLTSSLRASSLKSPEPSALSTTSSIMTSPTSASTLSKAGSVPVSVIKPPPAPAPTLEDAASTVRECLDTNTAFPSGLPPQAYGMILLELLENLVPEHVEIGNVFSREDAFEVLDAFPIVNVNVWISVTAFLHYIVQEEEDRVRMIAAVLAPVVLKDSPATIVEKRRFVRYFIEA